MRSFFTKMKRILTPLSVVFFAAGIVTIVSYLIFGGNASTKAESAVFLLVLYFCLLILGTMIVFLIYDRYKGGFIENATDPTYALLTKLEQPVMVCTEDKKILWVNKAFARQYGGKDVEGMSADAFIKPQQDLLESPDHFVDGTIASIGKEEGAPTYRVRCYKIKVEDRFNYITVWQDLSELTELEEKYKNEQPLFCYIVIDNLDDILHLAEGNYRTVASMIDESMQAWAKEYGGVIREYDRDKYQMFISSGALDRMIESKFDILDRIREIRLGDSFIPVTVSIGIARIEGSLRERSDASVDALETALQRGGGQAVVRHKDGMDIFGGTTRTVQKKTKIRARVMGTQLTDLICSSSNVLIMGHRFADFDAFGACIGAAHFCVLSGVPFNIVCNKRDPNLKKCFEKAAKIPFITKDTFIDAAEAQDLLDINRTLLIICDVNNPAQFEAPDLAERASKIVCIDHHRKTGEFVNRPEMAYIDPSSSSACELIADMLEQCMKSGALDRDEAELMLAGIVLDTKKYEINTGAKTFGAAQYLKNEGADPSEVQQLFVTDYEDYRREAGFGAKVMVYREKYAIAVNENTDDDPSNRIAAAKAADRLLSVEGVCASFAVCQIGDAVRVSGRSNGKINVQLILERMNGGGRFDAAAAEVRATALTTVLTQLREEIDLYEADAADKDGRDKSKEKDKEKDKDKDKDKENEKDPKDDDKA
ncbi:MAG: DHH family phosphoesterase [Clostridia bacterium]|nr:DHH family phosphoesterase [Clostridia bacterium]